MWQCASITANVLKPLLLLPLRLLLLLLFLLLMLLLLRVCCYSCCYEVPRSAAPATFSCCCKSRTRSVASGGSKRL